MHHNVVCRSIGIIANNTLKNNKLLNISYHPLEHIGTHHFSLLEKDQLGYQSNCIQIDITKMIKGMAGQMNVQCLDHI